MNQYVAPNIDTDPNPSVHDDSAWTNTRILKWIAAAFLLLFIATFLIIAPQVQQRLDRQTKNRLEQAGISTAALRFDWDYRNLTVSGYLPEDISTARLASVMRGSTEPSSPLFAKGIRHLRFKNLDEGLPVGSVFAEERLLIQVNGDGSNATLSGVVQTDTQRKNLVDAALASGVDNVIDNLDVQQIEATAPVNQRVAALSVMLRELGPVQIKSSEIKLTEEELHYRVIARDKHSAIAIENAAAIDIDNFNVTGGVDLLMRHKLNLEASSDGERISLTGKVYSDAHRKRLTFAAAEAVGGQNVVDNLIIADVPSEAPELMARVDGVARVVSRFAPGITGSVQLHQGELTVNAKTGSPAVRDYLMSSTDTARFAGLSVTENIQLVQPTDDSQALQTELDKLVAEVRKTVVFDSGASVLSPAAMNTLDKVAQRISGYSDLVIEIEGHTDNVGRAAVNEQLSQSRANAVRNYLARSIEGGGRLIAVGYGHRKPLTSNDTAEGRQANRRVHFTVLKKTDSQNG